MRVSSRPFLGARTLSDTMLSVSLRRRRLATIALVATAPFVLSACGTSFGAQTNQQYQPGIGANLRDKDAPVEIYGALFVENGDGTATFSGTFLTHDDDRALESVQVTSSEGTSAEAVLAEPLELPAEVLVPVGEDGKIIVENEDLRAGYYASVTFTLASGDQVSLNVPIEERGPVYSDVARTPAAPEPAGDPAGESALD